MAGSSPLHNGTFFPLETPPHINKRTDDPSPCLPTATPRFPGLCQLGSPVVAREINAEADWADVYET